MHTVSVFIFSIASICFSSFLLLPIMSLIVNMSCIAFVLHSCPFLCLVCTILNRWCLIKYVRMSNALAPFTPLVYFPIFKHYQTPNCHSLTFLGLVHFVNTRSCLTRKENKEEDPTLCRDSEYSNIHWHIYM